MIVGALITYVRGWEALNNAISLSVTHQRGLFSMRSFTEKSIVVICRVRSTLHFVYNITMLSTDSKEVRAI